MNGEENGNGRRGAWGWAALGFTPGNVLTVVIALGSVFAAYVADKETLAVLRAENLYLKEQIGTTSLRVSTLEMRNDQGERQLRDKIDELRDIVMQCEGVSPADARRLRNGTRAP